MTMAKGLTSGYAPLGAVAMRGEMAAFFNDRVYQGGLTYNGHPLSLAAAIAVIEVMQSDHILEHATQMGEVMAEMMAELMDRHPSVGETRSIGLFGAIELVRNRRTREPLAPYNESSPEMLAIKNASLSIFGTQKYLYSAGKL